MARIRKGENEVEMLQWGRVPEDAEIPYGKRLGEPRIELQWGRVPEDAEMAAAMRCWQPMLMLQWGRVPEDAEIGSLTSEPAAAVCFNGAASLKTRKSATLILTRASSSMLQWGRVPEDAEMTGRRRSGREGARASMGPRP